jgi:hypothetical protein
MRINISDLQIIPVIFLFFRINRRLRRSNYIQYLKRIDKEKRAANILKNKDIRITELNIKKQIF